MRFSQSLFSFKTGQKPKFANTKSFYFVVIQSRFLCNFRNSDLGTCAIYQLPSESHGEHKKVVVYILCNDIKYKQNQVLASSMYSYRKCTVKCIVLILRHVFYREIIQQSVNDEKKKKKIKIK